MESYSVEAYLKATGVDKFSNDFKNASKNVDGLESSSGKATLSIGKMVGAIAGVAAAVGVFKVLRNAVGQAFDRIDTMERFDRVMTTITGSTEEAQKVLDKTNETVKGTAYGLDVAAQAVQNFATRGIEVDKATGYIEAFGDAVAFYGDGSNEQLSSVSDALSKMVTKGTVEMDQLNRLFDVGIDAVGMYATAMGEDAADVQKNLSDGAISAEDFIDTVSEAMMEGTNGVTNIAGAAKEAGASWSGSFANMRAAVARGVTNILGNIDTMLSENGLPTMRDMIAEFGSQFESVLTRVGEMIPPVIDKIKEIYESIKPWIPTITTVATVIGSLVLGLMAFQQTVAVITSVKLAIDGFRVSMAILNATMMANPIALVIGLLVALGALFVYLWKTSDTFREGAINAFNAIKEFVMPIVQVIVDFVMEVWGTLVTWWNENMGLMMEASKVVWDAILQVISAVMDALVPYIKGAWEIIQTVITTVWDVIKTVVQTAINVVLGIIKAIMQVITGNWRGAWETIKSTVSSLLSGIVSIISSLLSGAFNIISSILRTIKNIFTTIFNSLRTVVSGAFSRVVSAVKSGITRAYNTVKNFFGKFKDAGKNIVTSIADGIKGAIGKVTGAISNVVGKVRDFLPFSPAKIGPLTDIHRLNFGGTIADSIDRDTRKVQGALSNMLHIPNVSAPRVDIAGQVARSNANMRTSVNHEMNTGNARMENLLNKIANSNQVIVLDSGELVGATYNQYDRTGGNKTALTERWGR